MRGWSGWRQRGLNLHFATSCHVSPWWETSGYLDSYLPNLSAYSCTDFFTASIASALPLVPRISTDTEIDLNVQYQEFLRYYNLERLHLGIGIRTPSEVALKKVFNNMSVGD